MDGWPFSDDRLRAMYATGRADATARRLARIWGAAFSLGLAPSRWVTLEVAGRRSGRPAYFPLGMADLDGQWYLVPMLGEHCNWVRNVRAAHGHVIIRHRHAVPCTLGEIPAAARPPVLKRYLQQVPGARPHIPVNRDADIAEFAAIAAQYPVFLITQDVPRARLAAWRPTGLRAPRGNRSRKQAMIENANAAARRWPGYAGSPADGQAWPSG
jgi:hypothetical protein